MLIREYLAKFEEVIDPSLQEDWDNSGLQVGNPEAELKGVVVCLDVTREVIDQAIDLGANVIISHHPLIFSGLKSLSYQDVLGAKLIKAIKNDILIYSSHTSCDLAPGGINDYFFEKLGLEKISYISQVGENLGYGAYGRVEGKTSRDLIAMIKEEFDMEDLTLYGDEDQVLSKVGFVGGSGASFIDDALALDLDLYISGDIKHHDAMDAMERGLSILDLSHYNSERHFIDLAADLSEKITGQKAYKVYSDPKYLRKIF